jgi:hypothetical protein
MAAGEQEINVTLKLQATLVNLCSSTDWIKQNLVTHAFATMGRELDFWQGEVKDGVVEISHVFRKRTESTYEDELGLKGVPSTNEMKTAGLDYQRRATTTDHVILWLYRIRKDKGKIIPGESNAGRDYPHRTYLVGAVALNLNQLLKASVAVLQTRPSFVVKHNFSHTSVTCEVQYIADIGKQGVNRESIRQLDDKLEDYQKKDGALVSFDELHHLREPKLTHGDIVIDVGAKELGGRVIQSVTTLGPDEQSERSALQAALDAMTFRPSPLKNLAEVNELVQLEQTLVRNTMIGECQKGTLGLCDAMGGAFLNVRTFCQLYGSNVCFTDMDHIVRNRVAQFPAKFCLTHMWNAMQLLQVRGEDVATMTSEFDSEMLLDVYRTALTSEIMDSKQSEYYSDYGFYGASDATKEEADENVQPNPLHEYDKEAVAASEMWFYEKKNEGDEYVKFMMRPTDDQKQIVTGGTLLYNRIISDDCETSATFLVGIHKTYMAIRAYFIYHKIWDDSTLDDEAFRNQDISNDIVRKLTGWGSDECPFEDFATCKSVVGALANILRNYHLNVELCIGSASAAVLPSTLNPQPSPLNPLTLNHLHRLLVRRSIPQVTALPC